MFFSLCVFLSLTLHKRFVIVMEVLFGLFFADGMLDVKFFVWFGWHRLILALFIQYDFIAVLRYNKWYVNY